MFWDGDYHPFALGFHAQNFDLKRIAWLCSVHIHWSRCTVYFGPVKPFNLVSHISYLAAKGIFSHQSQRFADFDALSRIVPDAVGVYDVALGHSFHLHTSNLFLSSTPRSFKA